ncbi:MAG: universal stress protein [Gemmatimonadaceae bacterium]|nr:universal stress protein [Gemmatimonadaceae bacterium]
MTPVPATSAAAPTVPGARSTRLGPIVVATDGSTGADAAVRAAAELARLEHASLVALAVVPPAPIVATEFGILLPPDETETARRASMQQRVQDQIRELVGESPPTRVEMRAGDPATFIARATDELDARLVVIGIGRHDLLDRLFGGETALHVLRRARTPVFMVPQGYAHSPARLLIATDFSQASLGAAQAALDHLPGIQIVYLAHVAPRVDLQPAIYAAWITEYGSGVDAAFARFRAELSVPAGVTLETVTLTGSASRALLDFAKSTHVDAIVTGSRGHGLVDRLLVGSTATALVRGAQCAVFAVPGSAGEVGAFSAVPDAEWTRRLDEFTRHNAGRPAILEVDDPEIGAQAQHRGYPFQGAAWDHHDRRIEIMLGEPSSTRHLTRGIGDVRSVDIMKDSAGHDLVLRVAHGDGQTILTLLR